MRFLAVGLASPSLTKEVVVGRLVATGAGYQEGAHALNE